MVTHVSRPLRGIASVTVEYDGAKGRLTKTLSDGAARRFYCKMSAEGRNPKIVRAER